MCGGPICRIVSFSFFFLFFFFTLLWYLINFIIYNIIAVCFPRLICMDINYLLLFFFFKKKNACTLEQKSQKALNNHS
jgi:hypothetical protein